MGAFLIPVIVIVVVVLVLALGARTWMAQHTRRADELARPDSSTLDYVVPTGQDPVVVLNVLSAQGFEATTDPGDTHFLHISCPAGPERDRAQVRAIIETADRTSIDSGAPVDPGAVRFVDES
jgi:hypothetical protein